MCSAEEGRKKGRKGKERASEREISVDMACKEKDVGALLERKAKKEKLATAAAESERLEIVGARARKWSGKPRNGKC